jgi:uncharacterized protein YjaZ
MQRKIPKEMTIDISPELKPIKRRLISAILHVFSIPNLPKFKNLKISFRLAKNKRALADMEGVGGYCSSPEIMQISIDLDHHKFKRDPVGAVSRSLAHELYHAIRFGSGASSPNGRLFDCAVDEGLADQFVFEELGKLPSWNKKINREEFDRLVPKFLSIANHKITDNNYSDWFIKGSKKKKIPRWAGYSIGLEIIRKYERTMQTNSVLDLVKIPASEFGTFYLRITRQKLI